MEVNKNIISMKEYPEGSYYKIPITKSLVVGVTGKSGVGKNYFCERFCKANELANFHHIDVDAIAHSVLACDEEVRKAVFDKFGTLDRKQIGEVVFRNRHMYKELSNIIWVKMKARIDKEIYENPCVILNWILLPESSYWDYCDIRYLIVRGEEERIRAVRQRDHISEEYLKLRDSASLDFDKYTYTKVLSSELI